MHRNQIKNRKSKFLKIIFKIFKILIFLWVKIDLAYFCYPNTSLFYVQKRPKASITGASMPPMGRDLENPCFKPLEVKLWPFA